MSTNALTSKVFQILNKNVFEKINFDLSRRHLGEACTTAQSRDLSESAAICCARLPNGQMFVVDGALRLRTLSCSNQDALFEIIPVENLLSAFDLALARQVSPIIFVYLSILFCMILHH